MGPPDPVVGVTPTTLVSSWQIDPNTQKYVFDSNGNPLAMDGTAQRVYLLVCNASVSYTIITPQTLNAQVAAYRKALQPLIADGSISNLQVTATDDGRAKSLKTIIYQNQGTNRKTTLEIR